MAGSTEIFSFIPGGLASPPDTCNNSPLVPISSSSDSNFHKLPRPQFAKSGDLNEALDFSQAVAEVDEVEESESESEFSSSGSLKKQDQRDPLATPGSKKLPSVPLEGEEDEIESKKALEDSPEANDVVSEKQLSESLADDECSHMDGIDSGKSLESMVGVESPKDDGPKDGVLSRKPLSESEEVQLMVGVESEKDEGHMDGIESLSEPVGVQAMVEDESSKGDEHMEGVESEKPPSESGDVRPMVEVPSVEDDSHPITKFDSMKLSDSPEDPEAYGMGLAEASKAESSSADSSEASEDEGEGDAMNLSESEEDEGESNAENGESHLLEDKEEPVVGKEEANSTVGVKLKKISLDSSRDVDGATAFEPRRSARNAAAKNISYPTFTESLKYINGQRKRASGKDAVIEVRASNKII